MGKAESFNKKLDKTGNIKSDGRPTLGLDAKNLLEIMLDTSNRAFFIPAHIWTPWFFIMGSKSGFDSTEECFEDLTPHIFAVETGLSSDPPMNWKVSALDGFTLISNSDAHSPMKLGREANLFNTDLSYFDIRSAIKEGDKKRLLGTFEFFPQEGKYHLDGHRKCNIRFTPEETIKNKGTCPVCRKPPTLGVLYRVEELADQPENISPEQKNPFYSIIPLTGILSEILKVGEGSKRVKHKYNGLLKKLGPELKILHETNYESTERSATPLLSGAIKRVRTKQIALLPGYGGEFGKVKIFSQEEKERLSRQQSLFIFSPSKKEFDKKEGKKKEKKGIENLNKEKQKERKQSGTENKKNNNIPSKLNKNQKKAVLHKKGPLMIIAGPGTGKTRTPTHRIAYLVKEKKVSPENILAVTFTNKAAQEMRERFEILIKNVKKFPLITTFHSLCFKILQKQENTPRLSVMDGDECQGQLKNVIIPPA